MAIRLVATDVDGVLTDGSINLDDRGMETKRFNVRDGSAAANLRRLGIGIALVTGRRSRATLWRAREMRITEVHQGKRDKLAVLKEMSARLGIGLDEMAFIGDDLLDLAPLGAVGFSCAPADAISEVLERVDLVTNARGGEGVLREVAEAVIRQQNRQDEIMARYLPGGF